MYVDGNSADYQAAMANYPGLREWTRPLKKMERQLVGRENEIRSLMASFHRPELSNVILLAPAGAGKTSIVQGAMMRDERRIYLEVDMAGMLNDLANEDQLGGRLQQLFDETARYQAESDHEIVLFIDEFHKIVQKSPVAVEDLKPLLADSGTRGIRVVAATTYDEFRQWVAPNQALVERLQRLNVPEADHEMTLAILEGMCRRYGVSDITPPYLLESIYTVTQRYIPANAQPRKSILVLDAMVGWHRAEHLKMDKHLLAKVIKEQEGVEIESEVDPESVRARLDNVVYAQRYATLAVERRMQLCLAGLNNPTKPQATMLLSGSTGSGKTQLAKTLAEILSIAFIRFDMTEYSQPTSVERFRTELSNAIWSYPRAIVLLDEIEKACGEVTRMLLPVLDDARMIDANGREVSFKNAYILLTTNAGSQVYKTIAQYEVSDTGEGDFLDRYERAIKRSLVTTTGGNKFPPELLGRIDVIVPFQPLSDNTIERIIRRSLNELYQTVKKRFGVTMAMSRRVVEFLVKNKLDTLDSDAGGARAALQAVETEVSSVVARYLNSHPDVTQINVWVSGRLMSESKTELDTQARVRVGTLEEYRQDDMAQKEK